MSLYHTFNEANNPKFTVFQKPDPFIWKNMPFKNRPYIDSNIAGVNKANIMLIPKQEEKVEESVYPFQYQSCCAINIPVSPEYKQFREVITPP